MTLSAIYLEIPGAPTPLARHRTCNRRWGMNPASGKAAFRTWTYNPQAKLMQDIKKSIKEQYLFAPLSEPLEVRYAFHMPIPSGFSPKNRKLAAEGKFTFYKRPDCSNLIKFYEDCMNEVVYEDDKQIIKTEAFKFYSETPKTQIWIRSIGDDEAVRIVKELLGNDKRN